MNDQISGKYTARHTTVRTFFAVAQFSRDPSFDVLPQIKTAELSKFLRGRWAQYTAETKYECVPLIRSNSPLIQVLPR